MRIVISEFMDPAAVDRLRARHTVLYDPQLVDDPQSLATELATADALVVRNRTQVRGPLLDAAPRLKAVGRLGVGLDNIDVDACARRGIRVVPATGANTRAVAEYVIAAIMLSLRRVYFSTGQVSTGSWPRTELAQGLEVAGKTLGLIGFGSIGRLTAQLARGLGMQVIAHDPCIAADDPTWHETGVACRELDALLAESDVVSLHVPLLESTRNLIDAARLARMKRGAILINTARGEVLDEVALAAALRTGHLGGAVLDVFHEEPLPAANAFDGAPNLVLTPHIAGLTVESNARVSHLIAERLEATLQG